MYLIYGIQKSGLSIVNYFENKKIKFKMWDDNPIVRKAIKKNYNKDYFFNEKKDNLNDFEKIFVSPGISLRQKKFKRKNISKKRNKQLSPRRIAYLPKLGANLVTALAGLDVDNFTALCGARVREKKSARCIPSARVFEVRM